MMNGRVVNSSELCFRMPSGILVGGQSGSGKTTFVLKLLQKRERMFDPPPKSILYAYSECHPHIATLERMGVTTFNGVPSDDDLDSMQKPALVIFDDLLNITTTKYLNDLFIRKSHHRNMCVLYISQNIFDKSLKVARNNSHYIIILRTPSMALQIRTLGVQLFPGRVNFFVTAYELATANNFGYLLVDLSPTTDPSLRLRTNIFPGAEQVVFSPIT